VAPEFCCSDAMGAQLTIYYGYLFHELDYMHINAAGSIPPQLHPLFPNTYKLSNVRLFLPQSGKDNRAR
jgi:hypothetical protein